MGGEEGFPALCYQLWDVRYVLLISCLGTAVAVYLLFLLTKFPKFLLVLGAVDQLGEWRFRRAFGESKEDASLTRVRIRAILFAQHRYVNETLSHFVLLLLRIVPIADSKLVGSLAASVLGHVPNETPIVRAHSRLPIFFRQTRSLRSSLSKTSAYRPSPCRERSLFLVDFTTGEYKSFSVCR